MKCNEVREFLSQINRYYFLKSTGGAGELQSITSIPDADLAYLMANGYVTQTSKEDYDKGAETISRMSDISAQVSSERTKEQATVATLQHDESEEHSISFHLEGKEEHDALLQKVQSETTLVSDEQSQLAVLEANVNDLIQKKYQFDRLAPYGQDYLALTDLGVLVLNDLEVRNYRVADDEFLDFVSEIKATYSELRAIADKATSYVNLLKPLVPEIEDDHDQYQKSPTQGHQGVQAPSLLWATTIGLAKLQGDTEQIGNRFVQALRLLEDFDSSTPSKLMAAEMITSLRTQDVGSLESDLKILDRKIRSEGVNKELAAGVASTLMAARRYDGTYPTDGFLRFRKLSPSVEASAVLAVINTPFEGLSAKFQSFRAMFSSWGYTQSEDTEISSAFLAICELDANEVEDKLKYIVEQLGNYLQYPLVAASILASIAVFEAHEVLDLMEKAVTMLNGYTSGLERSEVVALAVRMIHGVRNEIVKQIDPTAKITPTPIQFTYGSRPGFFYWYGPVIIAHSAYHSTFSGMGGFHPAHSHGVGGFAG